MLRLRSQARTADYQKERDFIHNRRNGFASLELLRKICQSRILRTCKRGISQHNTRTQHGESSSVDAHEKISYPCPGRQIAPLFAACGLNRSRKRKSDFLLGRRYRFRFFYAFGDFDRHYRLGHLRASRARYRREQVREMENAR